MSDYLPHYNYQVSWSEGDNSYVATVDEFPLLSWISDKPHEALYGLAQVLVGVIEDMEARGEKVPVPNRPVNLR